MKNSILLSVLLLLGFSVQVSAQSLWNGARVGMSEVELKKTFKNLTPANTRISDNGTVVLWSIKNVQMAGEKFVVFFAFNGHKLKAVQLEALETNNIKQTEVVYGKVFNELKIRHGQSYAIETYDIMKNTTWGKGEDRILLQSVGAGPVTITYGNFN